MHISHEDVCQEVPELGYARSELGAELQYVIYFCDCVFYPNFALRSELETEIEYYFPLNAFYRYSSLLEKALDSLIQ